MPVYRLYFLDERNGSIERHEQFEAADDDHAAALIAPRTGVQPLELWSHGRRIARYESALALSGLAPSPLLVST